MEKSSDVPFDMKMVPKEVIVSDEDTIDCSKKSKKRVPIPRILTAAEMNNSKRMGCGPIYESFYMAIRSMSHSKRYLMMDAIFKYALFRIDTTLPPELDDAFYQMKITMDNSVKRKRSTSSTTLPIIRDPGEPALPAPDISPRHYY